MISEAAITWARTHPALKERLRRALRAIGYDTSDWMRVVMYRSCFAFIADLGPERLDALEISAGPHWAREFRFRSYTATGYPNFDICAQTLPARFDLIIADQVFEHLRWPYRAAQNVLAMLRPGGYFVITVPFLVRIHPSPIDCSRWSEEGLRYFLIECGFDDTGITTGSWGNRACLKANLTTWRKRGLFGSLTNEPDVPLVVWAFAQRVLTPHHSSALRQRDTVPAVDGASAAGESFECSEGVRS
ncbi:MAG TPA: methyltransferase domain-containing protein [Bryobacteraceae bacterium]|jgi:SAM-dependent methyltransferase|nr:methyltransferase domain-containing protein [Bryobacteraceae bacterium]